MAYIIRYLTENKSKISQFSDLTDIGNNSLLQNKEFLLGRYFEFKEYLAFCYCMNSTDSNVGLNVAIVSELPLFGNVEKTKDEHIWCKL